MHDAAGQRCKQAGNDKRAEEKPEHCAAMLLNRVPMRLPHRDRQHRQREDRQKVNGTPLAPDLQLMNEKSADAHDQRDSDRSDGSMLKRAFRRRQLDGAQHKRTHRSEGVQLNGRTRLQ
jgi:hypothetical protein